MSEENNEQTAETSSATEQSVSLNPGLERGEGRVISPGGDDWDDGFGEAETVEEAEALAGEKHKLTDEEIIDQQLADLQKSNSEQESKPERTEETYKERLERVRAKRAAELAKKELEELKGNSTLTQEQLQQLQKLADDPRAYLSYLKEQGKTDKIKEAADALANDFVEDAFPDQDQDEISLLEKKIALLEKREQEREEAEKRQREAELERQQNLKLQNDYKNVRALLKNHAAKYPVLASLGNEGIHTAYDLFNKKSEGYDQSDLDYTLVHDIFSEIEDEVAQSYLKRQETLKILATRLGYVSKEEMLKQNQAAAEKETAEEEEKSWNEDHVWGDDEEIAPAIEFGERKKRYI